MPRVCVCVCVHARMCSASLVAQMVKNLPAMQETRVPFLGQEHPMEKGNGYPLQYYCLKNYVEKPVGLQSMGLQRVGHD